MRYKPGQSGNPNGRPKGSPNITKQQTKELVNMFIENNWRQIQRDFDSLKPRERIDIIVRLLKYNLTSSTSIAAKNKYFEHYVKRLLKQKKNENTETS